MKSTGKMKASDHITNRFLLPGKCLLMPGGKFFLLKKINTFMLYYSGKDVKPDERKEINSGILPTSHHVQFYQQVIISK